MLCLRKAPRSLSDVAVSPESLKLEGIFVSVENKINRNKIQIPSSKTNSYHQSLKYQSNFKCVTTVFCFSASKSACGRSTTPVVAFVLEINGQRSL